MTIEAKIRISAIVDQAVKALRQVKAEAEGVADAAESKGKPAFVDVSTGAVDAAVKTKALKKDVDAANAATVAGITARKTEADAARAAAKVQKAAAEEAGAAIRQARNQARQLGPQLTDITVGLATGQSPFLILLQQGGQLKDVFGGVGGAFKALASVFTVGRIIVGGLAAAIGSVGFAALQGARESDALNKSLALTGNIAATSAGQLDAQAKQIASSQKASIGDVRATLAALVATGDFTATSLGAAGRAAVALSKLTGESAADASKQFDGLASNVVAGSAKLNKAYNFLTVEQFRYIQNLAAQGRSQEAAKVTLDALTASIEQRAAPAVGALEKLWNNVKAAVSGALDSYKALGRDTTVEERIAALSKKLAELAAARELAGKSGGGKRKSTFDAEIAEIAQAKALEQETLRRDQRLNERKAADAIAVQKEIEASTKSFQDGLAQLSAAQAQRALAETLAGYDKQQAALDLAHARGLDSERDYDLARNAIDRKRLQAQAATIQRQIAIANGKAREKPEDSTAIAAEVQGLLGQLAQVRGQITQAAGQARSIVAKDTLDTARTDADKWAQIWQRAADQVRTLNAQNGATQAALIADPVGRATAEAALKTADLRRQVADLQRDLDLRLSLTVDPGQRAELERQIAQLGASSKGALEEATRSTLLASFKEQLGELNQTLLLQEQALATAVEQGSLTATEAEARKFAARAASIPQLETILRLMQEQAATPAESNAIKAAVQDVDKLRDATTEFQKTTRGAAVNGFSSALTDIVSGAKSGKAALLDMVGSFAKAMLDVLSKRLAAQLVDQFLDAGKGAGGGGGGFLSTAFQFIGNLFHSGGVVGAGGGATRAVSPAAFAFAPRYHAGGIAGLRPREVPSILLKGEEVLTENDPRHVKNFRGGAGGVTVSVTVNGAQGSGAQQQGAGDSLGTAIEGAVRGEIDRWATRESRQGGILARGR